MGKLKTLQSARQAKAAKRSQAAGEPVYMVAVGLHVNPETLERKVQVAAQGCSQQEAVVLLKNAVLILEKEKTS